MAMSARTPAFGESFHHHECKTPTSFPAAAPAGCGDCDHRRRSGTRHFSAAQPTAGTTPGAHRAAGKTGAGRAAGGRRGAPMSPVQAATATRQTVPRYLSGLGTATAANTVTVTSRVDGQLMAIHFTEGQQVKAGDLLAEIDPRPFEVQLTGLRGSWQKIRPRWPMPGAIWRAISNW